MTDDNATLSAVRVFDAVKALAFIGDLSMGQPTGHSLRTAWLATRLATESGADPTTNDAVRETSLLRWSGCTANAAGFADVFGDDIAIRIAMVEDRPGWTDSLKALGGASAVLSPLAQMRGLRRSGAHVGPCGFDRNGVAPHLRDVGRAWPARSSRPRSSADGGAHRRACRRHGNV